LIHNKDCHVLLQAASKYGGNGDKAAHIQIHNVPRNILSI